LCIIIPYFYADQKLTAMESEFIRYFEQRFSSSPPSKKVSGAPFVTISRETGCNSIAIAEKLVARLNAYAEQHKWRVFSKEILSAAAEKLQLHPNQLEYIFTEEKRSQLDEIMQAFSKKYYKSDKTVRKTICEIIHEVATEGHAVIVGRAGIAITKDLPNSLHCRLHAPLSWRVKNLAGQRQMSEKDTLAFIADTDGKREQLIYDFSGHHFRDINFDITLNNERLTDDEIAVLLFELMKLKHMLH